MKTASPPIKISGLTLQLSLESSENLTVQQTSALVAGGVL
jgi:hypothetical protein